MARHSGSKIAVLAAVAGNLAIAVTKFIAAAITGSSAMISEGIHSIVDTGNGLLLLRGIKRAAAPPGRRHPFGHGKDLYFYSLVVAVSIFGIGGGMSLYEGIAHIRHVAPDAASSNPAVNYLVLAIAFIIEGISFSVAYGQFRKAKGTKSAGGLSKTARIRASSPWFFEDTAALIGLVLAFLGVFFGHVFHNPYLDGAASIAIGILLMGVDFLLATSRPRACSSAKEPTRMSLPRSGGSSRAIEDVERAGDILTMYMGPDNLLVNLGVQFKRGAKDEEIHRSIRRIETAILKAHPECRRVCFEAESLPMPNPRLVSGDRSP